MRMRHDLDEGSLATARGKGSTAGSVDLAFITLTEPGVPMKQIKLTQGKFALVDDVDYEWLNQWKWCVCGGGTTLYAMRNVMKNKETEHIKMHRVILGLRRGDGKMVDHVDRNGLNNQRSNIRICTKAQNAHNSCRANGKSKYKGVTREKRYGLWQVTITIRKDRRIHIGYFKDEIAAARAYDIAAIQYFGEFARPNFAHAEQ